MPDIQVIQYPGLKDGSTISPPCWKVHLALKFKGLDYTIINVNLPNQVKRHNPRGRMPAIKIDQQLIVDSSDIITALDEKFPEPPLNSKDPRERAQIRVLEDWADENLYFYAVYIRWMIPDNFQRLKTGFFGAHYPALIKALAPSIGRREIGGRLKAQGIGLKGEAVIRRELRECFETIEAWLDGRDFLVGASLSRADISVFAVIDQLCEESLTPRMAKEIDRFANMKQWRERMAEETWSLSRT